ncbi:MAG: Gfo/Idh/MocA family oxidoreductase [Patescibacteria group bacterium]|jgi:predicted dehydrogenase
MKKLYKAAVIGCGRIGALPVSLKKSNRPKTHAEAYQLNSKIQLAGLVDTDKNKLKLVKKFYPGVPIFTDPIEMLEKIKPDIVSITTAPKSHSKLICLAAKSGCRLIFCEKPISLSINEAEEAVKYCQKRGSKLLINHHRHFDPLVNKWKKKIDDGLIGPIYQGTAYYHNGFFNYMTHMLDLMRMVLGEADSVCGWYNKITSSEDSDVNIDGWIKFKKGTLVSIHSLTKDYGFFDLDLLGEKGRVTFKAFGSTKIEYQKKIKNKFYSGYYDLSEPKKEGKLRSPIQISINRAVSVLDGKSKQISTGQDAMVILKILLAFKKSADLGNKEIKLK